ncbi:uncharacterized protein METZ01_LOCUS111351 [marine metagenome]|uniref:PDZ domain-containing protein n=1 Tax=marine metagenome TaxID=408172 RepID=A0A381X2V1_9ZZZZ
MNENTRTILTIVFIGILGFAMVRMKNSGAGISKGSTAEITENEIMYHIRYLSHDNRVGRYPGTRESKDVISYLVRHLRSYGVKPAGENGSFLQSFNIVDDIGLGDNNSMFINGDLLSAGFDYVPLSFSGNGNVSAAAVFAGYGFNVDDDDLKWNDYTNLDVRDKWVVVMRHSPERNNQHSTYTIHSGLHKKMLVARDMGAAGIIFISQVEDNGLYPLKYVSGYKNTGIPAIHLSNDAADRLLKAHGWERKTIQETMNRSLEPVTFQLTGVTIRANVNLVPVNVRAANVVGIIQSINHEYKDEYVVLGAHFDHLGMGGKGSGSRKPDQAAVHNGADDNASGTAGLLELAQKLTSKKIKLKRSVLLVGFDAEEKGVLGSKYFVDHPTVDINNIVAMLNLDMIGRMKDSTINVGGVGTSPIFEPVLDSLAEMHGYDLNMTKPGFGPSDHASFYTRDIPVLFFFTGFHDEYHTPNDTWNHIALGGTKDVVELVYDVIFYLSQRPERPRFTDAGPKTAPKRNTRFKVTFGIVPSYGSMKDGLEVDGISSSDGPASKAGMKKGDVIKSIGGKPIKDIYEYMDRLGELKPGMTISVVVERNGVDIELSISL